MKFLEVEKSVKEKEWNMSDLHGHSHYEIYFLMSGTRQFFISNKMYKITAPCLVILPPYTMHKTEGFGFSRVNINITESSLNAYELHTLKRLSEKAIQLKKEDYLSLLPFLNEAVEISNAQDKFTLEKLNSIVSYLIYKIDRINNETTLLPITAKNENVSPISLKIIDYINSNFNKEIYLESLSKMFFLSKVSLCASFKKAMNCTIGEYILRLRINNAKQYLSSTKKGVEEISELCGFSSGAYMGLIFKKEVGISPLQYRKIQKEKQ